MPKGQLTQKEKDLMRRYLVWCYKTTKEELDKIDRYFTQLIADNFTLKQLKGTKGYKSSGDRDYKNLVDQFKIYMDKKESSVLKKKFKDRKRMQLNPDYQYLRDRLSAIEKTIKNFLGVKELTKIDLLYEQEMTRRILEAREHT